MSEPDNQQGKNRNIQFLRGLAIILVLFAHGSVMLVGEEAVYWDSVLQHILPGVGVDLFFLISGYLMGVTFLRKQRQFDLIAVYGFYKKRIRRVLIPTWFWAAAVVLLGLLDLIDGSPAYGMQAIVGIASSAAFFLANVYNALHETDFGYFWSIALEVQFYLFFPLLLLVGRYFWWAVIAILLWLSFASPFSPEWLFRANALFAGLLIWKLSTLEPFRLAEQEINQLSVPSRAFISVAAVLCAAVVASTLADLASFRWTAATLILAVCFVLNAFSNDLVFGALSRPVEAIGNLSFSLYLCHIPAWLFTMHWLADIPLVPRVLTCVTVSLIVAYLSYRYLEQPLTSAPKGRGEQAAQPVPVRER